MRFESRVLAFRSSARRPALSPRPARFIKYVSIFMPDPGPFGETFLEASTRAIVGALLLNSPAGGCVESVLTFDIHRVFFPVDICTPFPEFRGKSSCQTFSSHFH